MEEQSFPQIEERLVMDARVGCCDDDCDGGNMDDDNDDGGGGCRCGGGGWIFTIDRDGNTPTPTPAPLHGSDAEADLGDRGDCRVIFNTLEMAN